MVDNRDTPAASRRAVWEDRPARVFLVVVDDTPEYEKALRYACRRARSTGGRVALLHIMAPLEVQSLGMVQTLMANERRSGAERLLQKVAAKAQELSGSLPILFLREGDGLDVVLTLCGEDPQVSILVLGAATGRDGPGPLVTQLSSRAVGRLRVPMTIVPGNMDDDEIDALS